MPVPPLVLTTTFLPISSLTNTLMGDISSMAFTILCKNHYKICLVRLGTDTETFTIEPSLSFSLRLRCSAEIISATSECAERSGITSAHLIPEISAR